MAGRGRFMFCCDAENYVDITLLLLYRSAEKKLWVEGEEYGY